MYVTHEGGLEDDVMTLLDHKEKVAKVSRT